MQGIECEQSQSGICDGKKREKYLLNHYDTDSRHLQRLRPYSNSQRREDGDTLMPSSEYSGFLINRIIKIDNFGAAMHSRREDGYGRKTALCWRFLGSADCLQRPQRLNRSSLMST